MGDQARAGNDPFRPADTGRCSVERYRKGETSGRWEDEDGVVGPDGSRGARGAEWGQCSAT